MTADGRGRPLDEQVKLIALFAIADRRRRKRYCVGVCSHAGHHLGNQCETGTATV